MYSHKCTIVRVTYVSKYLLSIGTNTSMYQSNYSKVGIIFVTPVFQVSIQYVHNVLAGR